MQDQWPGAQPTAAAGAAQQCSRAPGRAPSGPAREAPAVPATGGLQHVLCSHRGRVLPRASSRSGKDSGEGHLGRELAAARCAGRICFWRDFSFSKETNQSKATRRWLFTAGAPHFGARPVSGVGLGLSCSPASLLWSPGPRPSPVFRSAVCDCLSLNVSVSLFIQHSLSLSLFFSFFLSLCVAGLGPRLLPGFTAVVSRPPPVASFSLCALRLFVIKRTYSLEESRILHDDSLFPGTTRFRGV